MVRAEFTNLPRPSEIRLPRRPGVRASKREPIAATLPKSSFQRRVCGTFRVIGTQMGQVHAPRTIH